MNLTEQIAAVEARGRNNGYYGGCPVCGYPTMWLVEHEEKFSRDGEGRSVATAVCDWCYHQRNGKSNRFRQGNWEVLMILLVYGG